jgi:hypothetical protein
MKKTNRAHFLITPFSQSTVRERLTALSFLLTTFSTPYVGINPNTIHPTTSNNSIDVQ